MAGRNESNEQKVVLEGGALRPREIQAIVAREAKEILGVSAPQAFAMLDRGELEGTAAEGEFRMLRRLASAD